MPASCLSRRYPEITIGAAWRKTKFSSTEAERTTVREHRSTEYCDLQPRRCALWIRILAAASGFRLVLLGLQLLLELFLALDHLVLKLLVLLFKLGLLQTGTVKGGTEA